MEIIEVTPIMTSNATPSPCIVKAKDIYSDQYHPYYAFNEDVTKPYVTKGSSGWVQIDLGEERETNQIIFKSSNQGWTTRYAEILGSNDGVTFTRILLLEDGLSPNSIHAIDIDTVKYKVYRVFVKTSGSYTGFGDVKLLYKVPNINGEKVSSKNASLSYRLPLNTTDGILSKRNDYREGLLGMANDPDNYGDLYVVGKDGKSHLTKAGMKDEVIFDGWLSSETTTDISNNIEKYKYLIIEHSVNHKVYGDDVCQVIIMLKLESIRYGVKYQFRIMNYNDSYIDFSFNDATTISIDKIHNNNTGAFESMAIKKIIGIY